MKQSGLRTFLTIWSGQMASQVGTAMTRFALLVWAYQQTGSASSVALLGFFAMLPSILISPFAGVWVDRLDRRRVMLFADGAAGLTTLALLALYLGGGLSVAHLYGAELLLGSFAAFQQPAYAAATAALLPKEHYARANGLRSMAMWGANVLAPLFAGAMLLWLGLGGVMLVDLLTCTAALVTLAITRLPLLRESLADAPTPHFWGEMRDGFRYLSQRPGLLGLTLIFTGMNFFASLTYFSTMPAMILARSGGDELALATVQGVIGAAGLVGAIVVSVTGGPKRKIHGVLFAGALSFLFGDVLLAAGRGLPVWMAGAAISALFGAFMGPSNDAIWQAKVAPAMQGRVFATKNALGQLLGPVGFLISGVAADYWLEPAMQADGSLAPLFGGIVGTGPGAGIALMFVVVSLLGGFLCLAGYLWPALVNVEEELPDHDFVTNPGAVQAASREGAAEQAPSRHLFPSVSPEG